MHPATLIWHSHAAIALRPPPLHAACEGQRRPNGGTHHSSLCAQLPFPFLPLTPACSPAPPPAAACHMGGQNSVIPERTLQKAALEQYLAGGFSVQSIITQASTSS